METIHFSTRLCPLTLWIEDYLLRPHPVEVWVWISLPHPLVLTDLLHGQPPAGLQHQHVSDQVLAVCNITHTQTNDLVMFMIIFILQ